MTPLELLHAGKVLLAESPELSSADAWQSTARQSKFAVSPSSFGALAIAMGGSELKKFEAAHSRDEVLSAWDRAIDHLRGRNL